MMSASKHLRTKVYEKYNGHCGYCGNGIKYKDMQVDHMNPKCLRSANMVLFDGVMIDKTDCIENLMPTCRRCNHYKRGDTVESFRASMKTLHKRLENLYTHKVAIDYGIVDIKPFDGIFYFEKLVS